MLYIKINISEFRLILLDHISYCHHYNSDARRLIPIYTYLNNHLKTVTIRHIAELLLLVEQIIISCLSWVIAVHFAHEWVTYILLLEKFLWRVRTLCVALHIAPYSCVHSNAIIHCAAYESQTLFQRKHKRKHLNIGITVSWLSMVMQSCRSHLSGILFFFSLQGIP